MHKLSRLNPILEILRTSPRRIEKLFIQGEATHPKIREILMRAQKDRVPCEYASKKDLDGMDRHHQGVIAHYTPPGFVPLESLLTGKEAPFLVLLDGVEDPQNLGAIARTAEAAGVDGLVLPERRSVGLTDAAVSVSAGALAHISVARVKNLARSMDRLREHGVWLVGSEARSRQSWDAFDYRLPLALVFGSEGRGLRPLIRKKCDALLSLPQRGRISSLNVAAAAAVFMYEVVRQRKLAA